MIRFITPIPKNSTLKIEEISLVYRRDEARVDYQVSVSDEAGVHILRERKSVPKGTAIAFLLANLPSPVQLFDKLDQWIQGQMGGTLLGNADVDIAAG